MHRIFATHVPFLLVILALGCAAEPAGESPQPAHSEISERCELSLALESADYRGGEQQKHWHLTNWSLRNDSSVPIDEAVLIVTLFDDEEVFLGHHAITFVHVMPGETASQKRLLFLKSDNLGPWRARCESVQSRMRGDLTETVRITTPGEETPS